MEINKNNTKKSGYVSPDCQLLSVKISQIRFLEQLQQLILDNKTSFIFNAHGAILSAQMQIQSTNIWASMKDTASKWSKNRAVLGVGDRTWAESGRQKGGGLPGIADRGDPLGRVVVNSGVLDI